MQKLEPCPFCSKSLTIRGSINPYGICDTEGCWLSGAKIGISCDDPKQVERWNTRAAPAPSESSRLDQIELEIAEIKAHLVL